jgi:multicomponent Na+:H+ antiporter subunit C
MNLLPWVVSAVLLLAGIYGIVTTRNTIHLVSCLFVAQSSGYLVLVSIGYRTNGTVPILQKKPPAAVLVDPVVQALTLTDIVVSATVSALILALAIQVRKKTGSVDPEKNRPMRG